MEKGERTLEKFGVIGADKEFVRERAAKEVYLKQSFDNRSGKEKI